MALDTGKDSLRLWPNWVPRAFCIPGKRLKLHPDDYYPHGGARGGIDERWFASIIDEKILRLDHVPQVFR